MSGKNSFSNIKLIEGDVIHIPNVKNRVEIGGKLIDRLHMNCLKMKNIRP